MGIGWSIHRNDGWRGQLERLRRWDARTREAARTGSSDLEDFIFVFFQYCYQMREWLLQTSKLPEEKIDRFYTETKEMRLCRDICNGTKHLNLSAPSVDAGFSIGWEYAPSEPNGARLFLIADDKYDLLELAGRCMALTEGFVASDASKPGNGPGTVYRPTKKRAPGRHLAGKPKTI